MRWSIHPSTVALAGTTALLVLLAVSMPAGPLPSEAPEGGLRSEPSHSPRTRDLQGAHSPAPTCLKPAPKTASRVDLARFIVPPGLHVAAGDADLDAVLARWEAASGDLEPVGLHERRRLIAVHHPGRSAHELDVICELRGPIDATSLSERYEWRGPLIGAGHIELAAETRDAVERLFFRGFTLKLDRETYRPVSIEFDDAEGSASPLPFALETDLCLEARLARGMRGNGEPRRTVVPVEFTAHEDPPPPAELPPPPARIRPLRP
ncbi:MAG TPA: hypothetical protein VML55_08385 [Planctomycetaceae bacterium]|nr:hypothetical protein [Planctomycetaceae bacterium]